MDQGQNDHSVKLSLQLHGSATVCKDVDFNSMLTLPKETTTGVWTMMRVGGVIVCSVVTTHLSLSDPQQYDQ